MRSRVTALLAAALLAAGCGGDDGGGGGAEKEPERKPATAESFLGCFEQSGYKARRPPPREESVLAFQAKQKGFKTEPVNVTGSGKLVPAAFIVFFDSAEKAGQAVRELKATALGGVGVVTRGPAVIGYTDAEERAAVEPAVNRCIE